MLNSRNAQVTQVEKKMEFISIDYSLLKKKTLEKRIKRSPNFRPPKKCILCKRVRSGVRCGYNCTELMEYFSNEDSGLGILYYIIL